MSVLKKQAPALSRRHFLAGSAAMAAIGLSGCGRSGSAGMPANVYNHEAGIQLYTLRDAMAADFEGTLRRVAEIGYREVEFAGLYETPPARVRALLDELGMTAPSGHYMTMMADEPEALLDEAAEAGIGCVTMPWLPENLRTSADSYRRVADHCNEMAEKARARGMDYAYHNHDFEFETVDGEVAYDILMQRTDADLVDFELDLYWAQLATGNVMPIIEKAPERFTMCHVKDMAADGAMADVGQGQIDFAAIFASDQTRFKHFFVERDDAPNPFETAEVSYQALTGIFDSAYNE